MKITLIFATMSDGARTLLLHTTTPISVQEWAATRLDSFRLLGIVSIDYEEICVKGGEPT